MLGFFNQNLESELWVRSSPLFWLHRPADYARHYNPQFVYFLSKYLGIQERFLSKQEWDILFRIISYLFLLVYLALMTVAALSKSAFHNENTLLVLKLTSVFGILWKRGWLYLHAWYQNNPDAVPRLFLKWPHCLKLRRSSSKLAWFQPCFGTLHTVGFDWFSVWFWVTL